MGCGLLLSCLCLTVFLAVADFTNASLCVILSLDQPADKSVVYGLTERALLCAASAVGFLLFLNCLGSCCFGVRRESFTTNIHTALSVAGAVLSLLRVVLVLVVVQAHRVNNPRHVSSPSDEMSATTVSLSSRTSRSTASGRLVGVCANNTAQCPILFILLILSVIQVALAVVVTTVHVSLGVRRRGGCCGKHQLLDEMDDSVPDKTPPTTRVVVTAQDDTVQPTKININCTPNNTNNSDQSATTTTSTA